MHIDIGAADREEAAELVRVGDPVVIAAEPMAVAGDRLVSRAMDNRLGAYVALESLRRAHEARRDGRLLRRRRRRPGGDRPLRRPHRRLRGPPRHRDRRRRHPRHRRARGRREGDRQPPARLRPGDRPRLHPLPQGLRAAGRDRRGGGHRATRSAPAVAAPAPTPTCSRSPAPASPPASSRSRSATCTRRSRWSTCATSRRRSSCWRPLRPRLDGRRRPQPLSLSAASDVDRPAVSSLGSALRLRQPSSVTTTRSSIRTPSWPGR